MHPPRAGHAGDDRDPDEREERQGGRRGAGRRRGRDHADLHGRGADTHAREADPRDGALDSRRAADRPGRGHQARRRRVRRREGRGRREWSSSAVTRVINFSAGPAVLPEEVLAQAAAEMLDWHGSGMSVMEMSHRGKEFISIAEAAEKDFRELLKIPSNYKVLFLQGGATLQFGMVPMNLLGEKKSADYIYTGEWSKKAIKEANRFCEINIAASSEGKNFTFAPEQATWQLDPKSAYVHYTSNETIGGVGFPWIPGTGAVPRSAGTPSPIPFPPPDGS